MNQQVLIEVAISLQPWIVFWALAAARLFGFAMAFPLFTFVDLPVSVRFAFATAFSLPVVASMGPTMEGVEAATAMTAGELALIAAKEVAVGVTLGVIAGLPLWAALGAGELIDTYRGSSAGALFDHTLRTESSEVGVAFILIAFAVLVWSGGVSAIVVALYGSYSIWPLLDLLPTLDPAWAVELGTVVTGMLANALAIGGLMLLALFAIDMAFAMSARSTRQIQVFELTLNMKNLAFAVLMPLLALPLVHLISKTLYDSADLVTLFAPVASPGGAP